MENRRFSTTSSAPSMSTLRHALNPRAPKEKMAPTLKKALDVLSLKDLDGLENHFLATTAFLKPWSQFRDNFLLVQPGSVPRASEPNRIRAMDILWFYTNFSDGELRYDPRADDTTSVFTTDESKYGNYDTTHWGAEEHDKMMYAWLLQEFKVGKGRNPFGFRYFELQNVCTAWQVVFVPIVEAVRDSYDPRGRRYYGRLASFIEERHPSRVAFPEGNVMVPQSANPYRMVSYPRERGVVVASGPSMGISLFTKSNQPVTGKEEVALEKELRDIYPKYGQVVEKPKWRPADFFASQAARVLRKKRDEQDTKASMFGKRSRSGRESPMFMCKGVDDPRVIEEKRRSGSTAGRSSIEIPSAPVSPTKRGKKDKTDKKTMIPNGMYGFMPGPIKDKSPLHGVTQQLSFPDTDSEDEEVMQGPDTRTVSDAKVNGRHSPDLPPPPKPSFVRPSQERKDSDRVYSSIRNSNPFTDNAPGFGPTPERKSSIEGLSPMIGHPSAIPKPLFNTTKRKEFRANDPQNESAPSSPDIVDSKARMSSYEGTGYDREIGPPFLAKVLHSTLEYDAFDPASRESSFVLSEIPEIGTPLERQDGDIPKHVPWPGMTPMGVPSGLPWPGQTPTVASPAPTEWPRASRFDDGDAPPPIPPRHPARAASVRSSTGSDLPPPPIPTLLGPRIVSKENIRGHLSNPSRDISEESLQQARQRDVASTSPPKHWETYHRNMFPRRQDRKGTPVGAWMERPQSETSGGGGFEMTTLVEDPKR